MNRQSPELQGQRLSFLELIANYKCVEIPLIQRDYAQGRDSAKGVRDRFLDSLLAALQTGEPLSLDFIYGEIIDGHFQPIDGQQRLTTLFLLHWFLACAAGKIPESEFSKIMKDERGEARFRYSVRHSSHQFFWKLLDYVPMDFKADMSDQISDQSWFFQAWQHDPTVKGALMMLDDIQKKFACKPEVADFFQKLANSDSAPITMDVLNLGNLGLSDEIYVKMNARGKELTGFEKFKAWLIKEHKEHDALCWTHTDVAQQWPVLLDGDWLDLFWRFHHTSESPAESVSKVYFRTIIALAVNSQASQGRFKNDWLLADADDQEKLWKDLFTQECVKCVFQSLHFLSSRDADKNFAILSLREHLKAGNAGPFTPEPLEALFFDDATKATKDVTFRMRLWLHAICVFYREQLNVTRASELRWFRVIRNLLANTEPDAKSFANAVRSIDSLGRQAAAAAGSVLHALTPELALSVLSPGQIAEEKRKAALILDGEQGDEWERVIMEAELHPVFQGQIELLLQGNIDLARFKRRWDVFQQLFDENGSRLGIPDFLIPRAVLAYCESIQLEWREQITLNNTLSNWRALLSRNCDQPKFREGALKLIDHLTSVNVGLENALRQAAQQAPSEESWMSDIIRDGSVLLGNSENKKVQNYFGHGVFLFYKTNYNHGNDILLGPGAAARNTLIQKLAELPDINWQIEPPDSQLGAGETGKVSRVFYKGHQIRLTGSFPEHEEVVFLFDHQKTTVRWKSQPKDEEIIGFESGTWGKLEQIIKVAIQGNKPLATVDPDLPAVVS